MMLNSAKHQLPLIAVIDDDPLDLKLMSMLLSFEGYETILWNEAATACEMIRQRQPDVVTLDLAMQNDWNAGLTVLECLRLDPSTRDIPVIIVSATADTLQGEDRSLRQLAHAWLVKPIGAQELYQFVAAALQPPGTIAHKARQYTLDGHRTAGTR